MCENFSLIDFFKQYPNEAAAVKFFEELQWPNGIKCPYCGSTDISDCEKPMPHRCRSCRRHFSVRTGTILSDSKLPLLKWLLAIYILTNSKKGISSIKMAEYIGVTQKTAWFLAHRIREAWFASKKKMAGTIEVDETYVGGLEKNKHSKKKLHAGSGVAGKVPVFGLKSRSGEVRAFVVAQTDRATLCKAIRDNVQRGAIVYTDTARPYHGLRGFIHNTVNHYIGEYARGEVYTNSIESFWAFIKRGYKGVYHQWSKKHLQRYINEYVARFNMRGISPFQRMCATIQGGYRKHLSYKELIHG